MTIVLSVCACFDRNIRSGCEFLSFFIANKLLIHGNPILHPTSNRYNVPANIIIFYLIASVAGMKRDEIATPFKYWQTMTTQIWSGVLHGQDNVDWARRTRTTPIIIITKQIAKRNRKQNNNGENSNIAPNAQIDIIYIVNVCVWSKMMYHISPLRHPMSPLCDSVSERAERANIRGSWSCLHTQLKSVDQRRRMRSIIFEPAHANIWLKIK